jgi:hypothetical protein
MTNKVLRYSVLLVVLVAPITAYAASGIGAVTGTSTPQVVTPPTNAAPQTPANQSAPIGTTSPGVGSTMPVAPNRMRAPAKHSG